MTMLRTIASRCFRSISKVIGWRGLIVASIIVGAIGLSRLTVRHPAPVGFSPFTQSPYAGWLPPCPEGLPIQATRYDTHPYPYWSVKMLTYTERGCGTADRSYGHPASDSTDVTVYAFASEADASTFLHRSAAGPDIMLAYSKWRPQQPVDEFVRVRKASTVAECLAYFQRTRPDADCIVGDILLARIGRLVLGVEEYTPGDVFLREYIVLGETRIHRNETLMADLISKAQGR